MVGKRRSMTRKAASSAPSTSPTPPKNPHKCLAIVMPKITDSIVCIHCRDRVGFDGTLPALQYEEHLRKNIIVALFRIRAPLVLALLSV